MSEGHPSDSIGARRIALADSLVDPHGAPKDVVAAEDIRVTQLMAESYAPYEGWSKMREYGHRMLAAVGIVEPKKSRKLSSGRGWLGRRRAARSTSSPCLTNPGSGLGQVRYSVLMILRWMHILVSAQKRTNQSYRQYSAVGTRRRRRPAAANFRFWNG